MYLPLGESPEKRQFGRAWARVLLGFVFFAFAVGVFAPWHGAQASWSLVQHTDSSSCGTSSSCNITASNPTGSGHLLVVVMVGNNGLSISSVSGGGTWTHCSNCAVSVAACGCAS